MTSDNDRRAVAPVQWRSGVAPGALGARARLMAAVRRFMAEQDVLEVDTPLLSAAAPSERALDCLSVANSGYLVPSPEHALKRLLAEGHGALYQLGHVFRAGEVGRWHNPEFTMLEWYRPGDTLDTAIDFLSTLFVAAGAPSVASRVNYRHVFWHTTGIDPLSASSAELAECADRLGVAPETTEDDDRVFWLDLLMATHVQPTLGRASPVVVTHFPSDDAVLIADDPHDPRQALRFECFWQGVELANGAEELVDASKARQRMIREQNVRMARGGPVPPIDERLLAAMDNGLGACAGVALGIDRLLALSRGYDAIAPVVAFAESAE